MKELIERINQLVALRAAADDATTRLVAAKVELAKTQVQYGRLMKELQVRQESVAALEDNAKKEAARIIKEAEDSASTLLSEAAALLEAVKKMEAVKAGKDA